PRAAPYRRGCQEPHAGGWLSASSTCAFVLTDGVRSSGQVWKWSPALYSIRQSKLGRSPIRSSTSRTTEVVSASGGRPAPPGVPYGPRDRRKLSTISPGGVMPISSKELQTHARSNIEIGTTLGTSPPCWRLISSRNRITDESRSTGAIRDSQAAVAAGEA